MNDRIRLTEFHYNVVDGGSISPDTLHRIATERGYVKADPPKPAETEAERMVRIANALPEAAKWFTSCLVTGNDKCRDSPKWIRYDCKGGGVYNVVRVDVMRRELIGALSTFVGENEWKVFRHQGQWLACDNRADYFAKLDGTGNYTDHLDALADACARIAERNKA